MKINISGKLTGLSKKEARFATRFFADMLMSDRLIKNLYINIKFRAMDQDHPGGECTWADTNFRPKEYDIEVANNFSRRSQLLSLAHEMVHVKQFAIGELMDYTSSKYANHSKWRNVAYNYAKIDYYDHPWEIEAYGRELGLYVRYKKHLKKSKKHFK
jgi:hypothetical protein